MGYQFQPADDFQHSFDKKPFVFQHTILKHELFSISALHRLARRAGTSAAQPSHKGLLRHHTLPGYLYMKGRGPFEWGSPEFHRALDDTFENLDASQARLKLSSIHKYEGYREVLADCTQSLSEVTGVDFNRHYESGVATLFIASPHEVTPYHIDLEANFLLQFQGQKSVDIYDGEDPSIVTQSDLEEFWSGHIFLKQHPEATFRSFEIGPGQGIFNPPFFPHVVRVGQQSSVSLSLGFARRFFPEAEIHRLNAYMRKLGCRPQPPGRNPNIDMVKSLVVRRALFLKHAVLRD